MRHVKLLLLLACVVVAAQTPAQDKLPPLIDRELFFGPPEIAGGQLSPDGKYMSFLKVYKGTSHPHIAQKPEPVKF